MNASARFRLGAAVLDGAPLVVVGHAGGVDALGSLVQDAPATLDELVRGPQDVLDAIASALGDAPGALDEEALRWLAPVRAAKVLCVGANYQDHNREMLGEVRHEFPYFFLKPPTALAPHGAAVALPGYAQKVDYEAELAVVLGDGGAVFGYAVLDDLSVRDWVPGTSVLGIDWLMAKGFDGSAPLGPWVTPARFVPDVQALAVRTWVNGDLRQDGTTADMVFTVEEQLAHLRRVLTLQAGDVVATGTPAGVGMGRTPPAWLREGDVVRIEIEGLGTLEHTMARARGA